MSNVTPDCATQISEGMAKIALPGSIEGGEVFYNPAQNFNRDITCLVMAAFRSIYASDLSVYEAFSASGLRSIRYALEVAGVMSVVANDLDPIAFSTIKTNISVNNVEGIVKASNEDANASLSASINMFDCIDLDPYGSISPFLDSAVRAVKSGGLLCINSTDGNNLCGAQPDNAYALYNSMTLNADFAHEFALRTLLKTIASTAVRNGRRMEPLLSLSANFYFRVFVRIFDNQPASVPLSICLYSNDSGAFWLQPFSEKPQLISVPFFRDPWTGGSLTIAGPIYSGSLHSKEFASLLLNFLPRMKYLNTYDRIHAVISSVMAEIESPLYYDIGTLSSIAKVKSPPRALIVSQLEKNNFKVSLTHAKSGMIKTDAPPSALWDIIRCWYLMQRKEFQAENAIGNRILCAQPTTNVDCTIDDAVLDRLKKEKDVCKYYQNASTKLGPKAKAAKRYPKE